MAQSLRQGIDELSLTTRTTLAVLALASGVYTYLGVRDLLDGTATLTFLGGIIYSAAVSVGIYAFWSYLIRFLPHVREARIRRMLYGAMGLGAVMIIAMSSWLNAAALAGSAALEQHLAEAAEGYARNLDQAHNNALAAQSLLPDIQLAADRFSRLAEEERASGALTGTSGSGTVVQLLSQMSAQMAALADQVAGDRDAVAALYAQGGRHLSAMRRLVSASGEVAPRGDAFADEAVALTGVIAAMQQTSIAPAVRRAADSLERAFIAPVADGGTQDLRARQSLVVGNVSNSVAEEASALARAADEILARPPAETKRFVPLSKPEAVLRYAGDFLPSWAGAISIDLMPAVLVVILSIVQIAIRQNESPDVPENRMTASDMINALQLYERMRAEAPGAPLDPRALDPGLVEPNPQETGSVKIEPKMGSAGPETVVSRPQSTAASATPSSGDAANVTPLSPKPERK